MSETILTAENLKFRYDAEQPVYALDGVSVQVKRGEFVAVLGANGCGKSTLAKHFNAILLPESGKVYVEGMDTADEEKLYDIRQTVGMVFQNPDNQIVATVVEEDVAFALENLGVPQDEMRRRVDDSMKMAGIYEYRYYKFFCEGPGTVNDFTGKYVSHSQHQDQQCGDYKDDLFYCGQCVHDFFVDFHALYSSQKFLYCSSSVRSVMSGGTVTFSVSDRQSGRKGMSRMSGHKKVRPTQGRTYNIP